MHLHICKQKTIITIFIATILLQATAFAHESTVPVLEDFPLPESLTLCGEPLPLGQIRIREMLEREFIISVWDRAQVFLWLRRAGRYFPHIEQELAKADLPDDLKYLAVAESALITSIKSPAGALGSWQFMKHTARRNGLRKNRLTDERLSFEHSTTAALKLLKRLKEKFGTWTLAMAAYNCGEACVAESIENQKVADYYRLNLPEETERYVFRIAAVKIIMENPERYGYHVSPERVYQPVKYDTTDVNIRIPLHITDIARKLDTDFKTIKELNPQLTGSYLPKGRYILKIPPGLGTKAADVLKKLSRAAAQRMKKSGGNVYVIKYGDTLSHIAVRNGITVKQIRKLNDIEGSLIFVGQKLRLYH